MARTWTAPRPSTPHSGGAGRRPPPPRRASVAARPRRRQARPEAPPSRARRCCSRLWGWPWRGERGGSRQEGGRARRARRPEEKGGAVGEMALQRVDADAAGHLSPPRPLNLIIDDQVRLHREQVRDSFICTVHVHTYSTPVPGWHWKLNSAGGRRGDGPCNTAVAGKGGCAAAAVGTYMTASGSWKGGGAAGLQDGRGCREGQGGGHSGASSPGSNRHLPPPAVPYEEVERGGEGRA